MKRMKRLICSGLLIALVAAPMAVAIELAETPGEVGYEEEAYVVGLSYLDYMFAAAVAGSEQDLLAGAVAEAQWNQRIEEYGLEFAATDFFESYGTPEQIAVAIANYAITVGVTELGGEKIQYRIVASSKNLRAGPDRNHERVGSLAHGTVVTFLDRDDQGWLRVTDGELTGWVTAIHLAPFDGSTAPVWVEPAPSSSGGAAVTPSKEGNIVATMVEPPASHTQDDLFWLALTIQLEAGSDGCCDEHQMLVGNVVLNRVAHAQFPNSIHGVVHQRGQYPWAAQGIRVPISDRAWNNAQRLLNGERLAPPNVVFQAQFRQGNGTFREIHCSFLGTTTFFGYI